MARRVCIYLALMLALQAMISAQAVGAQLTQASNDYSVEVTEAQAGEDYLLVCVAGNVQALNANTLFEDGALLYIRQVKAQADSFSFGGFVPSAIEEATVFIVDSAGNKLLAGVIREPEKGDLDGDGMVTANDRELMLQYLASCIDISESALSAADVDYSGYIDVVDLSILDDMINYGW